MKRVKVLGVALVAVFAMSAVAAASASASASFLSSSHGELVKKGFTGTALAGTLNGAAGVNISCSGGSSSGLVSGLSAVDHVLVIFTGCENEAKTKKCKSSGAAAGEIKTVSLSGKLGLTAEATSGVGLLLGPESGTEFTEVKTCVAIPVKVTGSVIGEVLPVGSLSTEGELNYSSTGTSQNIKSFTGSGVEDSLKAFSAVESGLNVINHIKFEEQVEITS